MNQVLATNLISIKDIKIVKEIYMKVDQVNFQWKGLKADFLAWLQLISLEVKVQDSKILLKTNNSKLYCKNRQNKNSTK